jgi:hypothetical protein
VRDRPAGITERDLGHALADGWGIRSATPRYAPVGGGSYHWVVRDDRGQRRFVTVDDLDDKGWLGHTRPVVLEGLRAAMAAVVALRREAALGFVVAPVPALDGRLLRPLGPRHAVAVFPFLQGAAGRWAGDATAAGETVITHGEPHPGNIIRVDGEMMLVDWDTVGLARPERDLWMVASENGDELRRYTELTGRPVNRTALELYRLRWALDDISAFVRDLRARHRRTAGTEHAWHSLERALAQVAR